jgi:[ribosomal protein S18]-alanine N-acetyltransferase
MKESDIARALAIEVTSFHNADISSGWNPDGSKPPMIEMLEKQLREELARSWARLRVARSTAGDALGYVLFWHVTDEIHLLNVAVDPSARRHGIGRALTNEVIAYARDHGCARILLEARKGNAPAIGLYQSLGFSQFNVRERYYADGEDGVEMMLNLPQQRQQRT